MALDEGTGVGVGVGGCWKRWKEAAHPMIFSISSEVKMVLQMKRSGMGLQVILDFSKASSMAIWLAEALECLMSRSMSLFHFSGEA